MAQRRCRYGQILVRAGGVKVRVGDTQAKRLEHDQRRAAGLERDLEVVDVWS
jgi:hypothetical protein